ncbi:MAG: serine/threonine protein kinase [Polyangiaceae bacterium]|nr:serine/threonine protein kinase [Polyangiaceae bacterium]
MAYDTGDIIDERYKILGPIGKGGHGTVYRAMDLELQSQVAIKFLHADIAREPGFATRMQREARAMGQLSGTSAVQVFAFNKASGGGMYLVMEYLEGTDLGRHVLSYEEHGQFMPVRELQELLEPIATTLEAAHARGIIHRDLKLANIFVLRSAGRGRVRLLDFGLVKDMKMDPLTMQGMVAGSPAYIAPEAWLGKPDLIDHRIDVYSFGVVVFRLLAGQMPFDPKQTIDKLILQVTRAPRPSLHALRPDLPARIDEWVKKALAVAPNDRFQSVQSLWQALQGVLQS